jgi:cyanophycinase-like exopeptidase
MGRLLVFLARIQASGDKSIHGIGIDEQTAMLVEANGQSSVVGKGSIYCLWPSEPVPVIETNKPLAHAAADLQKIRAGQSFDLVKWCCRSGKKPESVEALKGQLRQYEEPTKVE